MQPSVRTFMTLKTMSNSKVSISDWQPLENYQEWNANALKTPGNPFNALSEMDVNNSAFSSFNVKFKPLEKVHS